MTPAEVAERYADSRAGMTLVDFVEVGLPSWRVLARCEILARKAISAIDETIMRATELGVDTVDELEFMLGLDETVLDSAITGIVAQGWAHGLADDRIEITSAGRRTLADAFEIVSREVVVPFDYDGLLRRLSFHDGLVDPRAGRDRGWRPVPASPERPPEVAEIRRDRQAIERLMRNLGDGREQESQLLAVRRLDRRDKQFLPAVGLVFAPLRTGRCEVAFAIDGSLSPEHEAAFTNANLIERLNLDRRLRSVQRRPLVAPGPAELRDAVDGTALATARQKLRDARSVSEELGPETAESTEALRDARAALSAVSPRTVEAHEHPALLQVAAATSRERLLIVTPRISDEHVNAPFLRRLRRTLETGALARIVYGELAPGHVRAQKLLEALSKDFPGLVVENRTDTGDHAVLISDSRFVVIGAYPWLAQLGDGDRPMADRRSVLASDPARADAEWDRWDGRTKGAPKEPGRSGRQPRPRHRGRRPASKS